MKILGYKSLNIIGGSLIVLIALIIFAWVPLNRSVKDLQTQIQGKRIDLALLQKQQNNSARSHDEADLVEKDNQLQIYFIQKEKFLEFVSEIEELSKNYNLKENVTLTEFPENTQEVFTHPISIDLTGDYNNIIKLMAELESQDFYLDFDQVNVSRPSGGNTNINGSSQLQLQVSLAGVAYWQK